MKAQGFASADLPPDIRAHLNSHSFFGSAGFAGLWRSVGGREIYWLVETGGRPIAVLPSVEFGRGPTRRLQAMPDGCYCRLTRFGDDGRDGANITNAIRNAIESARYARVWIYDYFGELADMDRFDVTEHETTVVDISRPGWEPPDKKLQSEIRKAEREGTRVERLDVGRHFESFLRLMEQTEKRHGRSGRYSRAFFEALAELAMTDDRVYWPIIEAGGKAAASHIYFVEADMALHWQAYFDKSFSPLKPNQYLIYTTARLMGARGVGTLNLGASPKSAAGLKDYKAKWGGVSRRYRCYQWRSVLGRLL